MTGEEIISPPTERHADSGEMIKESKRTTSTEISIRKMILCVGNPFSHDSVSVDRSAAKPDELVRQVTSNIG